MKRIAGPIVATLLFSLALVADGAPVAQYQGARLFALPRDFDLSVGGLNSSSAYKGQVVGGTSTVESTTATIWKAPEGTPTNINPPGYWYSQAYGTDGNRQAGAGSPGNPGDNTDHALVWSGTSDSAVDLHPGTFHSSRANDVSGSEQVGYGTIPPGAISHALLWHGSAESVVDLHPVHLPAYGSSQAVSTDGIQQVGHAANNAPHAALWSGTAASFIDLHPTTGFVGSFALDVMNGQQVGGGDLEGTYRPRALLWTGSADSVINLNPTNLSPWGYIASVAYGTNGVQQVGWGQAFTSENSFGPQSALLWSGTADSAVDLHSLLPPGLTTSLALSIDEAGVIWGAAMDEEFQWYAVMWSPISVPEPSALALMIYGACACAGTRRRPKR